MQSARATVFRNCDSKEKWHFYKNLHINRIGLIKRKILRFKFMNNTCFIRF